MARALETSLLVVVIWCLRTVSLSGLVGDGGGCSLSSSNCVERRFCALVASSATCWVSMVVCSMSSTRVVMCPALSSSVVSWLMTSWMVALMESRIVWKLLIIFCSWVGWVCIIISGCLVGVVVVSLVSSLSESSVSVLTLLVGWLVLEGVLRVLGGVLVYLILPILFLLSRCGL